MLVVIVAIAAWYWLMMDPGATPATSPTGAAGINGSVNQGNLGRPSTGQVQQPQQQTLGTGTAQEDQGVGDASRPQ